MEKRNIKFPLPWGAGITVPREGFNLREKGRPSDSVLWKKPQHHRKNQKATWQYKNATKSFITQRSRTDVGRSVIVTAVTPTGVVKPVKCHYSCIIARLSDVGLQSLFVVELQYFTFFSSRMHIFKQSFMYTLASRVTVPCAFRVNL